MSKKKLATVDEEGILVIYDTEKKEVIFQVFNPNYNGMLFTKL
jgi:hypothetical protein